LKSSVALRTGKPLRAAIYARYSSDEQRPESIEDQVEICRRYCVAHRWEVAHTYSDAAVTGATILRPEYQRLLQDAERGLFEIVVVEAVDRLSRRLADLANFHDVVDFRKVKLFATDRGEINALMVGLLGAMAQAYLEDLKAKTKRGLTGKILAGLSAGSLGYGYKLDANTKGKRTIVEDEAKVVRRIFEDYANGASPRTIAATLNGERVAGPRGRLWSDTTIRGQADRGTGLLNNELYVGRLVWNRQRFVKDPATGKRQARRNPRSEWIMEEVPELRIVDEALWERVRLRLNAIAQSPAAAAVRESRFWEKRRPRHILTGLVVCGKCGHSLAAVGQDYLRCAQADRTGFVTTAAASVARSSRTLSSRRCRRT